MRTFKINIIILFIVLVLFPKLSFGQLKNIPKQQYYANKVGKAEIDSLIHIKAIGKFADNKVKIRWAPTTEEYWKTYNKKGYIIQSFWYDTLGNRGKDFIQLSNDTIRPWSIKKFETYLRDNKNEEYVGVVLQCIYGVTPKEAYKEMADYPADLQNRYAFTLLAAEYSPAAAEAAGLSWTDSTVKKDRFYHYRIIGFSDLPSHLDTADVYINTFESQEMIIPVISESFEGDKLVGFSWDRFFHSQWYSGYYIEKSEDGKKYTTINKTPYVHAISDNLPQNSSEIKWSEILTENYKPFFYRIKGITAYGEISGPSLPILLRGIDKTPPKEPSNIKAEYLGDKKVKISWEHQGDESDLAGFMIGRSRKANQGFENISGEFPIDKSKRFFIDTSCIETSTNFYLVAAVDTSKNAAASLVSYAAILDTFPPSKPKGLQGSIDTNGVITLHWPLGSEPDIKGYFVWSTNGADHVMINVTPDPIQDTIWRDTIPLKTLTKEIYFVIQAVDRMSNSSAYSDTLRLLKPDIVPPVAPILTDYKNEVGKITLSWQTSTSPDVAYHQVLRKTLSENEWKAVTKKYLKDLPIWTDVNINGKENLQYCVVAVDSTGNISNKSTPINLKPIRDLSNPIQDFKVQIDTIQKIATLEWTDIPNEDYKEIIIYRAINKGPVKSLGRIKKQDGSISNVYKDKNLINKNTYEYTCKVVYEKGLTSNFYSLIEAKLQ